MRDILDMFAAGPIAALALYIIGCCIWLALILFGANPPHGDLPQRKRDQLPDADADLMVKLYQMPGALPVHGPGVTHD